MTIVTIIAIGFAQHYLGWGDWLWWVFGIASALTIISWFVENK